MELQVEYIYDPESASWGYRIPALHIVGSADTRADAERAAADSVLISLQMDEDIEKEENGGLLPDAEVGYLHVEVTPGTPSIAKAS